LSPSMRLAGFTLRMRRCAIGQSCASPPVKRIARRVARSSDYVVASERNRQMRPLSIVVWFNRAFNNIGLKGCSSHSGCRTFVTWAARIVHKAGGSLRDVPLLAGHRSIQTTQRYIDGDSDAQRKLVAHDLRRHGRDDHHSASSNQPKKSPQNCQTIRGANRLRCPDHSYGLRSCRVGNMD
jgi:Phage integrase family